MTRQRKILGMTLIQIGVLIGLGAAACCLFAIAGWLVMNGGLQPATMDAPVPQMTATLLEIPTVTSTATPAPIPYEQLIPEGWRQHKTALMEIWLPSNFKETAKDSNQELRLTGSASKTSLYKMNVIVFHDPLGDDTLDTYIDNRLLTIDPTARVVERRAVSLNGAEAVRLVFELRVETVDINELAYVIQYGDTAWAVTYTAQINEFYEMLPMFEQSAKTFRIVQ